MSAQTLREAAAQVRDSLTSSRFTLAVADWLDAQASWAELGADITSDEALAVARAKLSESA